MSLTDRRTEIRIPIQVPVTFRPLDEIGADEQQAESENLSKRGLFIATAYPLNVGTRLELFLKLPSEISGNAPADVECTARVVRIRPGSLGGKSGVGVRVERYRTLAEHGHEHERVERGRTPSGRAARPA